MVLAYMKDFSSRHSPQNHLKGFLDPRLFRLIPRKRSSLNVKTVILTLDAGEEDLLVREKSGVISLRQHRLQRICNESVT
jgi:hypothetical protein